MIRCKIVNLLTLFILTDLNRSAITQITSQPSSSVFTSSKLKIFPTPQSSNPLTDISIQTKFSDKNQNDQSIKFNKEITYTIVEESNVPQLIGDLINDFNLNKYLLRHVLNEPRQSPMHTSNNQNNQSKQMLSIDLIANHYQSTQYTDADLPRLHLFPSNQWSAEYFHINYHNLFKQELIQIKRLDRDRLCQLNDFNKTTEHQKNQQQLKHYDTCMCSSDICSTIYSQKLKSSALSLLTRVETLNGRGKIESGELALLLPYCQFIMTLAINLFHTGMEIFTIRIKLLDLNDNYPSFKPFTKYEVHFMEDDRIGVRRRLPLATDVDMCLHSEITYRLEAGESFKDEGDLISENVGSLHNNNRPVNLSNLFSLKLTETSNTKVLEIQLEHTLDREKRDKYDLYLLAIDDNSNFHRREENRHTTTLPIIVYIQDVNDCKPEFLVMNGSHYTPAKLSEPVFNEVAENVAVGYIITKFQAIDEDFGDNGRISYEMGQYTHSITKSFFRLNSTTGELIVQNPLDREAAPFSTGLHRFTITALDHGIPQRSSNLLIVLQILDVNDNRPLIQLTEEAGQYRQHLYTNPLNRINNNSELHNEGIKELWRSIVNNKTMTASSIIERLRNVSLHTKMIGNQPKNTIATFLTVNDPDLNENGTVTCLIEDQLVVYTKNYSKQIGSNYHSDDSYNNANNQFISLEPFEFGSGVNRQDWQYHQFDDDRDFVKRKPSTDNPDNQKTSFPDKRRNSVYYYNASTQNTNQYTYQLKTKTFFDPDKISDFYLLIQCHDHGTPSLTTKQTVHVEIVEKINDNREGELKFSYLNLLGNFIRNDVNCDYYYYYDYSNSISHSTLSGIYSDDQWITDQYVSSGEQESQSHHKMEFVYPSALHSTHFQAVSTVCLLLRRENLVVGQKLFTVVAKADGEKREENFQIIYELIQEIPDGNTFVIDSISGTVQLRNNQPLLTDHRPIKKQLIIQASKIGTLYDYSKHLNHKIRLLLNLTISSGSISDNQLTETSSTSLSVHPKANSRIHLRKAFPNNSFIVYSNHTYECYTPESVSPGSPVLLNTIVYCVSPFTNISEASNHLDKRCELKLTEIDSTPLLSDNKHFYLSPNKFLCDSYSNELCTGYTILTQYPLDREQQDRHIFTLTTTSLTHRNHAFTNPTENSVKIILHVQDVNDNSPTLKEPFYSTRILTPPVKSLIINRMTFNPPYYITNISISYKVPQGYVIIQMNAEDKDIGENARLSYTIHHIWSFPETGYEGNSQRWHGKSFIVLNSNTGILSTTRQLLLSDVGRYILYITVQDHGKPQPLSTNSIIYLNILPMEIYQRPVNDLPDSLSGSHTLSSSSLHSSSSSSASIHQFNTDEYDPGGFGADHLLHLSSQSSESLNKHHNSLLWPTTIGIASTIFLLIITIIVIIILYRVKSKSANAEQEEVKLDEINHVNTYNLDISRLSVDQNNTTYLPQYETDILLNYMDRSKCNSPNGSIPTGYIHPNLSSAASLNIYYPNSSNVYDTSSFNELTNPNLRYQQFSASESIQDGISAPVHYSPISHPFVHNISTDYVTENHYPTLAPTTESI